MPTIKVPENVELINTDGTEVLDASGKQVSVDFVKSFLLNTVSIDPKFGKSMDYIFASMDIKSAFGKAVAGDEVVISQDVLDKMKEVVKDPSQPYNVAVMQQCKSFFLAITEPHSK